LDGKGYGVYHQHGFTAWNGAIVPQRKIYNMPPENLEELANAVVDAISDMR